MSKLDLSTYLQDFGKTVRNLVSRTGIIFVYLVFLLVEQRTFRPKIKALFPAHGNRPTSFKCWPASARMCDFISVSRS